MEMNEDEIREIFNLFDSVGDNAIFIKDVGDVVRAAGLNPTESRIKRSVSDKDPGQRISFETFIPIYKELAKEEKVPDPKEFIEGFRVFDKESNGLISAAELQYLLTGVGEKMRTDEVDALLANAVNSQGQVSYVDFVNRILGLS